MPMIRPSSDLRNKYSDISDYCHQHKEPVFITRNGVGELAVMSMETYERLVGIGELRFLLETGLRDVEQGNTILASEVFSELEHEISE